VNKGCDIGFKSEAAAYVIQKLNLDVNLFAGEEKD